MIVGVGEGVSEVEVGCNVDVEVNVAAGIKDVVVVGVGELGITVGTGVDVTVGIAVRVIVGVNEINFGVGVG